MRFDRGANASVHLARASMRKHLLLEARQSGQDFAAALECNLGFFVLRFIRHIVFYRILRSRGLPRNRS